MKATPICAEALPQDELLELLASNQALLEHYLALYTASDFANVLPPGMNSPLPRFDGIFAAQQLLHAALLNEADAGKALQAVDRDLAYWRRVLAGTNVFISKMAAVRGAARALMVRGKLMERLDSPALRSLPPMPPLSPSEWAMRDAIRFEMGIDYTVMQDLVSGARKLHIYGGQKLHTSSSTV